MCKKINARFLNLLVICERNYKSMTYCDFVRKFMITTKVPETKGCMKCCVGRNPYNGYKYLCGCVPGGVFLMQWYDPLNKFMLLKVSAQ